MYLPDLGDPEAAKSCSVLRAWTFRSAGVI